FDGAQCRFISGPVMLTEQERERLRGRELGFRAETAVRRVEAAQQVTGRVIRNLHAQAAIARLNFAETSKLLQQGVRALQNLAAAVAISLGHADQYAREAGHPVAVFR